MYGKIFESMYNGSLACGDWQALVTMQQLIVLADEDGVVDMTAFAIHRRTTIPLEIIEKGLEMLQQPDPYSRNKAEEGRRIVCFDPERGWGWRLVNYDYYRLLVSREDKKKADGRRIAAQRAERKASENNGVAGSSEASQGVADSSPESKGVADVAHIEVNTDTDRQEEDNKDEPPGSPPPCPHQEIISLYHRTLPMCRQVRVWTDSRKRMLASRWREEPERQKLEWWQKYFTYVANCPFLIGKVNGSNGKPPFQVDLEWLVKPASFAKIIEGKYQEGGE